MKLGKNQIRIIILLVFVAASGIGATSNLINPVSTAVAPTNPAPQSTPQTEQEKILAELTKSIAGKENQNAGEIWKNVQQFKKLPANRFLRLMNTYTKVLGVSCSHCHIVGQWEKEDLQTKQIAREMLDMMDKINTEGLANIKNLRGKPPLISCYTCHRGQPTPETRLPFAPSQTQKNTNVIK